MKRNIFLAVGFISLFSFFGKGQINQGAFLVGGSTYFNYNIPKGGSGNSMFNISPNAGVFIVENMAIGAALDLSLANGSSNLSIAPFMRAYYKNQFYGQLQVGYGRYSSNFGGGSPSSYTGFRTAFDLGYTIFLTDQIAIDPALYYNFYMNSGKYGGSNLGMKLGFQIFLNHK
jgi:hypothetical protein